MLNFSKVQAVTIKLFNVEIKDHFIIPSNYFRQNIRVCYSKSSPKLKNTIRKDSTGLQICSKNS